MNAKIRKLFKEKCGIMLDLGCGEKRNPRFIGIDKRKLPGVDIVHDLEIFPWPLPNECCISVVASHLVEHIKPWLTVQFFNEVWRIMKPGGKFAIATPYAGSTGYWQDPSHCLLEGSEVLTDFGFKKFLEVNVGEKILTFNLETEKTEFSRCVKIINQKYEGDILKFKNRAIDIAVTPNHDLIWKTRKLSSSYHKSYAGTFENVGSFARGGLKTIPDWKGKKNINGDLMELIGWILSEGSFVKKGNYKRISIYQSSIVKKENYDRIENLLKRLGINYKKYGQRRFEFRCDILFDELVSKSDGRFIPIVYKNQNISLLLRILESLMLGDGEAHSNGGGKTLTTISKLLANDVSEIAVKCGLNAVIRERAETEFISPMNGKIYKRKKQYRISVTTNNLMLYPRPRREFYAGQIVCVQTEKNHNILTRYNGHIAWVGNCNGFIPATFQYFDPDFPLYQIYKPSPWKIENNFPVWQTGGNLEVILIKREEAKDGKSSWS